MKRFAIHIHIINWLHSKLDKKEFLLFSSILVGLTAGIAAVVLKTVVHYIHDFLTRDWGLTYHHFLYIGFPLVGILLSVWYVQRFQQGKLGRGVANVLYSIAKRSGFMPRDQMYSHIITSALTVGFGGSAGLEAPIVVTGSAIGSNYSKTYHLQFRDRTLLLACGAAAGIAAAFNAPVTGVLFALEVLLADVTISAFIPLIISAAIGALVSRILLGEDILLTFTLAQAFDYHNVPFYILLAGLAGLVSVGYARLYTYTESLFHPKGGRVYLKALTAGLSLAVLILFFPPLFGEGYESIKVLAGGNPAKVFQGSILYDLIDNGWLVVLVVVLTMAVKAIAAAVTVGGGGNGGNFAPSLFTGAYLGFAFSSSANLLGIAVLPVSNFTIVAMAGMLSGIMHAPLSAIFLIAEITGGYELMIPLMIVSAISNIVVKYFNPHSMDTHNLIKKGHIFTQNKDRNILLLLKTSGLIETGFRTISDKATLAGLVDIVAHTNRNIFPVVDEENNLAGIILLDTIREVMFKPEMYDTAITQFMQQPPATISINESMRAVMRKFDETGAWNLPVLDDGRYAGFISKSSMLTKYRTELKKMAKG